MKNGIHNYVSIVQHFQDRESSYVGVDITTCPAFRQYIAHNSRAGSIQKFIHEQLLEYKNGLAICVKNNKYCPHFMAIHNTAVVCDKEMTFLDIPDEK